VFLHAERRDRDARSPWACGRIAEARQPDFGAGSCCGLDPSPMGRIPDTAAAGVLQAWKASNERRSLVQSATRIHVAANEGDVDVATVEIRLEGRYEALALMTALIPFHSFVVQPDRAHWVVHARVPGCHDETLDELLATIERWGSDQMVELIQRGGDGERS
jgi:hypothetical protein